MKNKISAFFLISFFIVFIISMIRGCIERDDFDKNSKITIGKFVFRERYGKTRGNFFVYYTNGKRYRVKGEGTAPNEFYKNIGNFYKVKYSEKYVGIIDVLFDQQVKDTAEILNAGFTRDEILGKKVNPLFP